MASLRSLPLVNGKDDSSNMLEKMLDVPLEESYDLLAGSYGIHYPEAHQQEDAEGVDTLPYTKELEVDESSKLIPEDSCLDLSGKAEDPQPSLDPSFSLGDSIGSQDYLAYSKAELKLSSDSQDRISEGPGHKIFPKHFLYETQESIPLIRNKVNFRDAQREGKTSDYSSLSSCNSRVSDVSTLEAKNDLEKESDIPPDHDRPLAGSQSLTASDQIPEPGSTFPSTPTGSCLKGSVRSTGTIHVQFESPHESKEILPNHAILVVTNGEATIQKLAEQSSSLTEASPFNSLRKPRKKRRQVSGSSSMSLGSTSTSTSDSRTTEFERKAPDGGWGWVVVFASFMVHCIADGITLSFGVLYVEFLSYFQESKSLTSWVGSLFMAIPLLAGPLASYATDRFGCMTVTIWGSAFACLGFFISAFAKSLNLLFFAVGIITGLGLAVCYVAAIVIVAFYFEKRRSLATGIAVAGSGIGTFVFPPVIQYLIREWGWRGAMIILSGIFLNMCVCGSLMRDLAWTKRKKDKSRMSSRRGSTSQSSDTLRLGSATPALPSLDELRRLVESGEASALLTPDELLHNVPRSSSLILIPTFLNHNKGIPPDLLSCLSTRINAYEIASKMYPHLLSRSLSRSLSQIEVLPKEPINPTKPVLEHQESLQKDERKQDIMKRRRSSYQEEPAKDLCKQLKSPIIKNLDEEKMQWKASTEDNQEQKTDSGIHCRSQHKMSLSANNSETLRNMRINRQSMTFRGAMLNIHRYRLRASSCPNIYRNSIITIAESQSPSLWSCLSDMGKMVWFLVNMEYFKNFSYVIFAVSNFILYVFYDTVYMYMTDYAQGVGISADDSADLISAIGILNCIGMVIMGCLGDQPWSSPLLIYNVSMVICGISVIVIPFVTNYYTLSAASATFGFFISANYALTAVILVEIISLEAFSKSYGLLLLIQGIANLIGPPLVGFMADATGEYTTPFVVSGVFIVICGLLLGCIPCCKRRPKDAEATSSGCPSPVPATANGYEMKSLAQPEEYV